MLFERFKQIFLTYGICEIEFSLKENNERFIRIENYKMQNRNRLIRVYDKDIYFYDCRDLFNITIIEDCNLEQIWDKIQIDIIDGMIEEDYEQWYSSIEPLTFTYFYDYQVEKSINTEELIKKLCEDEYNGNLLLLAGTNELSDLKPDYFSIVIQAPEIHRFYILETKYGEVVINVLISFIEEIKKSIKHKRYSTGRLLDMYNDKNAKNKSEKYRELLKHEKSQNSLFLGGVLLSIEVVLFCLLLFTITKITTKPILFIVSLICFILSWVLMFKIGKAKKKKEKAFEDKYFQNINPNKKIQGEMNPIILEKYNTKFESFLNRIKQNDPKIKISGLVLEDNCIDLQLEKDSRGLYFNFESKVLMIFDENDITYYYRYDRYTYEELEDNLVKLVKNHFN